MQPQKAVSPRTDSTSRPRGKSHGLLAAQGGDPVRKQYLSYGRQWVEDDDIEAVVTVLKGDWLTTGPDVERFEQAFARWNGTGYAVAVSSGTAALHAATFAAGFGQGDEVITTPLTFAATANCLLYQGATPVFADIDPDTLCIDPEQIRRRVTSRTQGIIVMHYGGQPCDMDPIMELAREHGLIVVEDACHAMGATYKGRQAGTLGDLACYSFHPVKHITTGEGGMVVTQNGEWDVLMRAFRNHGITSEARQREEAGAWFYEMSYLGFNYRLNDFQCTLGVQQLEKLPARLARRRAIAEYYTQQFADLDTVEIPTLRPDVGHGWHLYVILLNLDRLSVDRSEVFRALRAENIGVNVHYIPVHMHPYYQGRFGYKRGDYPLAEGAYDRMLTLPLFPSMRNDDVADVVTAVKKVTDHYRLAKVKPATSTP